VQEIKDIDIDSKCKEPAIITIKERHSEKCRRFKLNGEETKVPL
jgi:hypothetical protein